MNLKLLVCAAVALFPVLASAADAAAGDAVKKTPGVYDRPIHLTYALAGGKVLQESDKEILAALDAVPGGVTSLNPFMLNTEDPSKYEAMLQELKKRKIALFFGVGKKPADPQWAMDSANMRRIAKGFVPYSDSIRVDNLQGYYNLVGREPIQSYIDYLVSIGFKHIMLNPWPVDKEKAVPFTGAESTIIEITLNHDHKTGEVHPTPTNWAPKDKRIAMMTAYDPAMKILVNYESEPQHRALARLESEKPGSSIDALEIAAAQCQAKGWYWCPPWTKIYDPVKEGTWKWMAARLGQMYNPDAPKIPDDAKTVVKPAGATKPAEDAKPAADEKPAGRKKRAAEKSLE